MQISAKALNPSDMCGRFAQNMIKGVCMCAAMHISVNRSVGSPNLWYCA